MKKFTLFLDNISGDIFIRHHIFKTYQETEDAIKNGVECIYTYSLASFSFDLLDMGYKMFAVKDGVKVEFYPGMPSVGNKDIRREHNLERMIKGHYFDRDFEN